MPSKRLVPQPRIVRALILVLVSSAHPLSAQPIAARRPVTDRYPGVTIVDPYRWMERAGSPAFSQWLRDQNAYTDDQMARIPGRAALSARVRAAVRADDGVRRVRRGGQHLFYYRPARDSSAPVLRSFALDTQIETALFTDRPVAQYEASPDGRWLAITTADNGRVLLLDVPQARVVDSLPRNAHVAGWSPSPAALLYTRTRRRVETLMARRLNGQPRADSTWLVAGVRGAPRWRATDAVRWLGAPDGLHMAMQVSRDESIIAMHVRRSTGAWLRATTPGAALVESAWYDGALYLLDAAGLLRFDPATARTDTLRNARRRALQGMTVARDGVYLLEGTGGDASLWRWRASANTPDSIPLPLAGSGRAMFAAPSSPGVVLAIDRWLGDGGWYAVTADRSQRLPLTAQGPVDNRFVVERRTSRSDDGTMVPLTIIRRRDLAPDSARLTWVMAYGAYGIPMTPLYQSLGAALVPFLEDGGIYVVAHVRGGGEFGAEWHNGGRAASKPNGYRDFITAVESLIAWRLAQPSRLVIEGASGGGATVGMAGVTRPDLFRVVITNVPDANTLRLHATPDGPYMRDEWGDIRTQRGARALAAMDITHHIDSRTRYPAWWATTGLRDESVPPWQPAKLIAHLQATQAVRPALLRVFPDEGHVLGASAQLALTIDLLSYALWQTGVAEFQPRIDNR